MSTQRPEPSNTASTDPAADETLSPLPGEAGIPSVAAHRNRGDGRSKTLAFTALVLAMAGASAWAYQHFAPATVAPKPDAARLADKPAAAGTEPRRLELSPAPVGGRSENAPASPTSATAQPTPPADRATSPTVATRNDPLGLYAASPAAAQVPTTAPAAVYPTAAAPQIPATDAPILLIASRPAGIAPAGHPLARPLSSAPTMASSPAGLPGASGSPDPLLATARNLEGYQQQLQGLLDTLTRTTAAAQPAPEQPAMDPPTSPFTAAGAYPGAPPTASPHWAPPPAPPNGALFGGQLQASHTPRVAAATVGNRSLLLPKGTAFTCALKTRIVSATSGLVGCQVQRHIYSDDGRVLLIERGSHLDGEYRIAQVRQGMVRIPVLWTRIRTPNGITVDLESPATGALGESGIDGHVDNRWPERIGAAMLLSLIDDSVKLVIQNQANERSGDTIVLPSTTANASKLAEKVLDSTINIPPLITSPQGSIVGIYVARDVDFSSVYELRPSAAR